MLPAPHLLPGSRPEHRQVGFWLSRLGGLDDVLLEPAEIEELNRRARQLGDSPRLSARVDLLVAEVDPRPALEAMDEAVAGHRSRAEAGARVALDGTRPPAAFFDGLRATQRGAVPADELRLVPRVTPLRCHPTEEGLYEMAGDVDFDLLLCSTARPGELLRVLARHPGGWCLVRTSYVVGWVRQEELGPVVSHEEARGLLDPERFVVVLSDRVPVWANEARTEQLVAVDLGLRLPRLGEGPAGLVQVLAPSASGLVPGWVAAAHVHESFLPLTRRNVIEAAFARLDDAFGWAGAGGDRDCSRFLMDLFALFGLELPRNSRYQSMAGSSATDLEGVPLDGREGLAEAALGRGVVLLYFPGHIMLLLGRDRDQLHAIHQFSGYRAPCRPGQDVKMAVDRVSVTTLALGEGSERRSFLERLTRLVVIGRGDEG